MYKHLVFQSTEENAYLDSTWKGLTALGGLYFMFLVEHLITLIKQFKDKKKKVGRLLLNLYCIACSLLKHLLKKPSMNIIYLSI